MDDTPRGDEDRPLTPVRPWLERRDPPARPAAAPDAAPEPSGDPAPEPAGPRRRPHPVPSNPGVVLQPLAIAPSGPADPEPAPPATSPDDVDEGSGPARRAARWLFAQAPERGVDEPAAPPEPPPPAAPSQPAPPAAAPAPPPPAAAPAPPAVPAPRRRPRPGPDGPLRPGTAAPGSTGPAPSAEPATWTPAPWTPPPAAKPQPLAPVAGFTPAAGRVADSRPPAPPRRLGRRLILSAVLVAVVVAVAVVVRLFVAAPFYIPSASMEPTLHGCDSCDDDHVLVDKLAYRIHGIHRGDVVVFDRPSTWPVHEQHLIKRVIGLPGDVLTVRKGVLYVNGLELVEPYLKAGCGPLRSLGESPKPATRTIGPVPPDEVFVMGDNRCDSADSRAFGPVPESDIVGRAFMIIWPLDRLHYL